MSNLTTTQSGYENVQKAQRKYFKGKKGGRMPLTKKGKKVFYASQNKGTIKGTHRPKKGKMTNMPGMSMHPQVDCDQSKRHASMSMDQAIGHGPMKTAKESPAKYNRHF